MYYNGFPTGDERLLPAIILACQLLVFQVAGVYDVVNVHALLQGVTRVLAALAGVVLLFLGGCLCTENF